MIKKQTKLWKCKDGTKIRICDMTSSHLDNTIKLIERKCYQARNRELMSAYMIYDTLQGDIASWDCENMITSLENDEEGERFYPKIYRNLVWEKERRNHLVPTEV